MKFENDFIKINIEKKKLTAEQKSERHIRRKKIFRKIIVLSLGAVLVVSGVFLWRFVKEKREYVQVDGEYITTTKLADGLREKYSGESLYNYTYAEPIQDVGRTETIAILLGYDVYDLKLDNWSQVFEIYQDPELTQKLNILYSFDEKSRTVTLKQPELSTLCQITATGLPLDVVDKYPHNESYLFDYGAGTSWGNLGTVYLASYRDRETGTELEKPEVSVVTFRGEIEGAPKIIFSVTEDGRARFTWDAVDGAEEYMICQVTMTEKNGYDPGMKVLGITQDTTWTADQPLYEKSMKANEEFKTFIISEDSWKNELDYEYNLEKYGEPNVPYYYYPDSVFRTEEGVCVIAVNREGTSMISNVYKNSDIASNLPYELATYTEKENGFAAFAQTYEEGVEKLPLYDYVTMCDGYTVKKVIDYRIEDAYMQDKRFVLVDPETGEMTGAETVACLMVPYRVEGTPFRGEFNVSDYDVTNMEKDLQFLQDREDKLQKKSGDIAPDMSLRFATHEDLKPVKIRKVNADVVANSALSEYLAVNMLSCVTSIDISEFPEAADYNLLDDAFMEAYYQNPLIFGVEGYRIDRSGNKIQVVYEETPVSQARKQQEVQEKVTQIIAEIITEDMSIQEKEIAINEYLCETLVYDEEALENAGEKEFLSVDEEFRDAFTAYGALVKGKSVCAGYAAAFHLLAQEAGLESVVVTGIMDGGLSHAWNKVKVENEWQIVDVTNNDNEFFYNALLNLPSDVGDRILVEDKDYLMDSVIRDYTGKGDENEYYHMIEDYFPVQEIALELSSDLKKTGEATLRTDYALNDSQFYEITDAIYDIMGDEIDLYGYYWLGVIYLTMKK